MDGSIGLVEFDNRRKHFWITPLAPKFIANDVYSCPSVNDSVTPGIVDTDRESESGFIALEVGHTCVDRVSLGYW